MAPVLQPGSNPRIPAPAAWFKQRVRVAAAKIEKQGYSYDELDLCLTAACDSAASKATHTWIPRSSSTQLEQTITCCGRKVVGALLMVAALPMLYAAIMLIMSAECGWPEWSMVEQAHQSANPWEHKSFACKQFLNGLGTIGPNRLDTFFTMLSPSGRWRREHCFPGLYVPESIADIFRPPLSCDFCAGVTSIPQLDRGITRAEFVEKYAFTSRPVIIRGGVDHWGAMEAFSFRFFQTIYNDMVGKEHIQDSMDTCNFFKYQSDFNTLGEALNQSYAEALRAEQPWYVGWANCRDRTVKEVFRRIYAKPSFLPLDSLDSHTDWVFVGLPGPGAQMHHDAILEPSWQAQVKGTKQWNLRPAPECADVCNSFQVEVRSGDIIMIDTHRWFHQTTVLGDEMSITIGSEYQTSDGAIDVWDEDRTVQVEERTVMDEDPAVLDEDRAFQDDGNSDAPLG